MSLSCRLGFRRVLFGVVVFCGAFVPLSLASAAVTERVTVDSAGVESIYGGYGRAISADGRVVAYGSFSADLVPGDTNGKVDVFVRDRATGQTVRASVSSSGAEGNGDSGSPAISDDGRMVVFYSQATDLVPNDTNGRSDAFARDLATGLTTRISVSSSGVEGNRDSVQPAVSADGRTVAFASSSDNLVPGDTNSATDVFARDLATGQTTRVSVSSSGVEGNSFSFGPAISANGGVVMFHSDSDHLVPGDTNGLNDIFAHDLATGQTTRVSVSSSGIEGNLSSSSPAISADGGMVVFQSFSSNLVPGDTNNLSDVFARNLTTGQTTRVSESSSGLDGNGYTTAPADVSADGRVAVFQSHSTNLVLGETDTNGNYDIFARDLATGRTTRVSVSTSGVEGNSGGSRRSGQLPGISADGHVVVFNSDSGNLVPDDTNGQNDVFVRVEPFDQVGGGGVPGGVPNTADSPITQPTPATPDTTKPILSSLSLSRTRFRAARSGPSISAGTGTRVSYELSELAAVNFRVERALAGRVVGGRCVRPTRANRSGRRCTRYKTLRGSFTHKGKAGTNRFRFRGRLRGRTLRPGRYRLRAVATDAAKHRSQRKRVGFRVVRR